MVSKFVFQESSVDSAVLLWLIKYVISGLVKEEVHC